MDNTENVFRHCWDQLERTPYPKRCTGFIEMPWHTFREKVLSHDKEFAKSITRSLYEGKVMILKNTYDSAFLRQLKNAVHAWGTTTPSTFHKMLDRIPDFHRKVDADAGKNYSFFAVKHMYCLFPWNEDRFGAWPVARGVWSVLKVLGGFHSDEYDNNVPTDGIVDRIVINHYPSGAGVMETHEDPHLYQKTLMGAKMNTRGEGYSSGGLYFIGTDDEKIDVDARLDVGDIFIAYPTVHHGVSLIDEGKPLDWDSDDGRWFLGYYSAVSDLIKDRHTGRGVETTPEKKKILVNSAY